MATVDIPAGHEVQYVANVLLPHVDANAKTLRWKHGVQGARFIEIMQPLLLQLLTDPDKANRCFAVDNTTQILKYFKVPPMMEFTAERRGSDLLPRLRAAKQLRETGVEINLAEVDVGVQSFVLLRKRFTAKDIIHTQGILSSVFLAADENNSLYVTWGDFTCFLVDAAMACSTQLAAKNNLFYVLSNRLKWNTPITFSAVLSEKKILVAHQPNSVIGAESFLINSSDMKTVLKAPMPYSIHSLEVIHEHRLYAAGSELALLFFDFKQFAEVARLGYEVLEDTPKCLYWSKTHNQLYVGCRGGKIWIIDPPIWNGKQHTWLPPAIVTTLEIKVDKEPILAMHFGVTEGVLFILTTRGSLVCYSTIQEKHLYTLPCSNYGMNLCTSMVFNSSSNYIICAGEGATMIAYVARNIPNQTPMKIADSVCPHASRVMGLVTFENSPHVVSMDKIGLVKIWDLSLLQCIQNIKLQCLQADFVALLLQPPEKIIVAQYKEIAVFSLDNDAVNLPLQALSTNPKGGSLAGAMGRDIVEWNAANGRKLQHLQQAVVEEISAICYSDNASILCLLTKKGEVSIHSSTTGKLVVFFGSHYMQKEGLAMVYDPRTRRLCVATVDADVWFFPTQKSHFEKPISITLSGGDTTCSCLAYGEIDQVSKFYVGTAENSVNVFHFQNPDIAKLIYRIPPSNTNEQMTCLTLSLHTLISADTGGTITLYNATTYRRTNSFKYSVPEGGSTASLNDPKNVITEQRYALNLTNYEPGKFVVAGDSLGYVAIFFFGKRTAPFIVREFQVFTNAVRHVSIDNHTMFTSGEAPSLLAWDLDGNYLSCLWGPRQQIHEIVAKKPSWYSEMTEEIKSAEELGNVENVSFGALMASKRAAVRWKKKMGPAEIDSPTLSTVSELVSEEVTGVTGNVDEVGGDRPSSTIGDSSEMQETTAVFPTLRLRRNAKFVTNGEMPLRPTFCGMDLPELNKDPQELPPLVWKITDIGDRGPNPNREREFACIVNCLGQPLVNRSELEETSQHMKKRRSSCVSDDGELEVIPTVDVSRPNRYSHLHLHSPDGKILPKHNVGWNKMQNAITPPPCRPEE